MNFSNKINYESNDNEMHEFLPSQEIDDYSDRDRRKKPVNYDNAFENTKFPENKIWVFRYIYIYIFLFI